MYDMYIRFNKGGSFIGGGWLGLGLFRGVAFGFGSLFSVGVFSWVVG